MTKLKFNKYKIMKIRKRIFDIISPDEDHDFWSIVYDIFLLITILASLIPLVFKEYFSTIMIIDNITVIIFMIDYILRWITCDFKLRKGKLSFLLYPITISALIDLMTMTPTFLNFVDNRLWFARSFRIFRLLKMLKIAKAFEYMRSLKLIKEVFVSQIKPLLLVGLMSIIYVLFCSFLMFNVEPNTFETFFDAVYWSLISLTSIGYGDLYPHSVEGKIVAMISLFVGIAIISLPTVILTASFIDKLDEHKKLSNEEKKIKHKKVKIKDTGLSEDHYAGD